MSKTSHQKWPHSLVPHSHSLDARGDSPYSVRQHQIRSRIRLYAFAGERIAFQSDESIPESAEAYLTCKSKRCCKRMAVHDGKSPKNGVKNLCIVCP